MKITLILTLHPDCIEPPHAGQRPDWTRSRVPKDKARWVWRVLKCDGTGFCIGERVRTLDIGLLVLGGHKVTKQSDENIIWPEKR